MDIKYPKGKQVWVRHCDGAGKLRYIITSRPARDLYFLYELVGGTFVKLGKDTDPKHLERQHVKL